MARNNLTDDKRQFFFGTITHADRQTILAPTETGARFSSTKLGEMMKKYVPIMLNSGLGFVSETSEHSIGKMVDNLTGRQDFKPTNPSSKSYARGKLKTIYSALKVRFIDEDTALRMLVACNFHEGIVRNILRKDFKNDDAFVQAFADAKAHQMYV
jgi:hypothetical protein